MQRPITASLLYDHLTCPHRVAMDAFADPARRDPVSPFVKLLWDRGTCYEREIIKGLGATFLDLSTLKGDDKEAATRAALERGETLIYNGRLSVGELLGEPDLLRRENGGYVAIDIKSGAGEEGGDDDAGEDGKLKKTYGVQIALYTDNLARSGLSAGRYGYIWDVHGEEIRYDLDAPLGPRSPSIGEVYQNARAAVGATLNRSQDTRPGAVSAWKMCVWRSTCLRKLKTANDLTLLPGLGRAKRDALVEAIPTVADLAATDVKALIRKDKTPFHRIGGKTLRKIRARAVLATAKDPKPYLTGPVRWPTAAVELFFDIEIDPLRDLCYLHGFVIREQGKNETEQFDGIFVEDVTPEAERSAFARAMAVFRQYPDAVVIHYATHERTHYGKLQQKYPDVCTQDEMDGLFARGRVFDLYYGAVQSRSEWATMDFSIKSLAKFCGFNWRDTDPSGASSVEWFDQWANTRDPAFRQRLLEYNEDDCRAMRVVCDAMKQFPVRA